MLLAAMPLFLGAFLLFMIQPLIAQRILPWFGGGASVWVTCMMFFQVLLLAGYVYADRLSHLPYKLARLVHCLVLFIAAYILCTYSMLPANSLRPVPNTDPIWGILKVLGQSIAIPFFVLSTTSSLIQSWLAQQEPGRSVHRLFALSNAGSLLALLSYPFTFEVWMTLSQRAHVWKILFVFYLLLMLLFSLKGLWGTVATPVLSHGVDQGRVEEASPSWRNFMKWTVYAALSSLFLSASTYHLTQDVAPIPLLWLLPLSIYLLTFIVAFDRADFYKPLSWDGPLACALSLLMFLSHSNADLETQVLIYSIGIFIVCYIYHAEIALSRPSARYLSRFYLAIALGGALGAIVAGVIAPVVLGLNKLFIGCLFATSITMAVRHFREGVKKMQASAEGIMSPSMSAALLLICTTLAMGAYQGYKNYEEKKRTVWAKYFHNFYASLKVECLQQYPWPTIRRLLNGTTMHGMQAYEPSWEQKPTLYYHEYSGVGAMLREFHPQGRRLGVVGLGVGTINNRNAPKNKGIAANNMPPPHLSS